LKKLKKSLFMPRSIRYKVIKH